jgi:hypothetical protein
MSTLFTPSPDLDALRLRINQHPVYAAVRTPAALATFAAHHVFAVWDFMSLLKRLQQELTCVAVPWMPSPFPSAARLINEIVLGEESDETPAGFSSHFELYRAAMTEIGAPAQWIDGFLTHLRSGHTISSALEASGAPPSVVQFVETTFSILATGSLHEIASAFTLTREDLVPQMFLHVTAQGGMHRTRFPQFFYYLDRHIELDSGSHGPLAHALLSQLCAGDPLRIQQADAAACRALRARVALWDGILAAV